MNPGETHDAIAEQAERAFLGGLLKWPEDADEVIPFLRTSDFVDPACREIYRACAELWAEGRMLIIPNILPAIENTKFPVSELSRISTAGVDVYGNVRELAQTVRNMSRLRQLHDELQLMSRVAISGGRDADAIAARLRKMLDAVFDSDIDTTGGPVAEYAEDVAEAIVNECKHGRKEKPIHTGVESVDRLLGGMWPGDLVAVGARTSVGKTAFCLQICTRAALDKHPVLFFSLEMSRAQLLERILASHGRVPLTGIRLRSLMDTQQERILSTAKDVAALPITIADSNRLRIIDVIQQSRQWARKNPNGVVIVDYIGILDPEERREKRHLEVADMTKRLKSLAGELKVPIIMPVQLNRQADTESDAYKKLGTMRESGSIEQDADIAILLSRLTPKQAQFWQARTKESVEDLLNVIVAKHRNGPTGIQTVVYDRTFQIFRDRNEYDDPVPAEPEQPPAKAHEGFSYNEAADDDLDDDLLF